MLRSKFPAVKRFGIEGAEAVLPGLHAMITAAARMGVDGVELGTEATSVCGLKLLVHAALSY